MSLELNSTEELIADIKDGKMVILMDDEDRENEGDLVIAANAVTPEVVNFMAKYARGLLCLTLMPEQCKRLELPLMVDNNTAQLATNFTVSIDAAEGITTGISAYDRYKTVIDAVQVNAKPADIVVPGHIFPLMAQQGGVLARAGHTEAGCDIAKLSGRTPAALIVEIMNDDGSMARREDLIKFSQKHDLKIGTIADLIEYRMMNETTVSVEDEFVYATQWGEFKVKKFKDRITETEHLAFFKGELNAEKAVPVRVQYGHFFRELRGLESNDDYWTAQRAMKTIADNGSGVMVVLNSNESVPIEIDEIGARKSKDNYAYQNVGIGSQILKNLGVGKMKLMSPEIRFPALSGFGLEITEFISYNK
ncbi:3,4-dihydroxy-2-butanone-4-phosphate synthase [Marinicella litoralis]|uniref:3,4-dihydroxy-2-butanone 4-phosphate synthase n=1 Tax=Marinicella litoralis TaxID=644220 RepID=A0A4R6XDV6_9GAMM|nr:3,4-dihydroxy-2-butanone-4-phosphate synthase [Marinicella litoralis]TDR17496.1 GTP cyclohydrolase II /3,4-dihydroxy-2-butanone 4-phosphate synthase [Marinicella litoralis]